MLPGRLQGQYSSFHLTTVCSWEAVQYGFALNNDIEEVIITTRKSPATTRVYFQAALMFMMFSSIIRDF
jgi:hypothetical protein